MAQALYRVPTQNNLQYTLASQLAQGASTAVLNTDVTGIVRAPGVFVVDRVDASGNKTPTAREYISFTGQSTTNLIGLTKGLGGSTDQSHNVGAIVEFIPDIIWADALYQVQTREHDVYGAHASLPSLYSAITQQLAVQSLASIQTAYISQLLSASGASLQGVYPSGASGAFIQSQGSLPPVSTILPGNDGWVASSDTYTYVSANSFKISGVDRTLIYTKGTRIKFTNNSTTYYGVVISSAFSTDTTVTLAANDDFAIANSAITSPFYSYAAIPQGYPTWFHYTPTYTGFSANPPSGFCIFSIIGSSITIKFTKVANDGTSNATTFTATAPVTSAGTSENYLGFLHWRDNSSDGTSMGEWYINGNSNVITLRKSPGNDASWTASGGKFGAGDLTFRF